MSLYRSVRMGIAMCQVFLPIFYRKLQLRRLYRIAAKRAEEVKNLQYAVHLFFIERCERITTMQLIMLKDMGYATDHSGERVSPICWNAPICFVLHVDEKPYIGLGVEFRGKALCVRQLQGVKGASMPAELLAWPELLVQACVEYAVRAKLKEVRVYKADQDINFFSPQIESEREDRAKIVKQHQDRMRRRYDRVAQKLKFQKKKRYYFWKVQPTVQS